MLPMRSGFRVSVLHFQPAKEHFSFCDLELCLVALIFELDLDMIQMNHFAKYVGQRSFCLTIILQTHSPTHTVDRLQYLDYYTVVGIKPLLLLVGKQAGKHIPQTP